jgi:hypothetical protein
MSHSLYANTAVSGQLSNVGVSSSAYSISSANGIDWNSLTTSNGNWGAIETSPTIQLKGNNADILINDKSLMKTLEGIEQRLGMLCPNPKLEAEWDELRELGQAYRKLEAELLEKNKMWEALKK